MELQTDSLNDQDFFFVMLNDGRQARPFSKNCGFDDYNLVG
jgi:hypothetical protein